jgi:hypothetical protein
MKIIQFSIFLIILGFSQCKIINARQEKMLIEFEKTKCRGACPVFTFKIGEKGDAYYVGYENVDKIGTYKSKLGELQLKMIVKEFDEVNFFDLASSYKSLMMDLQTKYITYRKNEKEKRIKIYDNAPKKLNLLVKRLDELVNSLEWKKLSN